VDTGGHDVGRTVAIDAAGGRLRAYGREEE
jgi:hypothetical protein